VFRGESPLYDALARGVAADPEALTLAEMIPPQQPPSNVLFGVAHYLLLMGIEHPVKQYYPSFGGTKPVHAAYPHFRDFCLKHAEAMRPLLATRKTQTNEARRCALLLPAFGVISRRVDHAPLPMIEVGASAGLNLLWDRYAYDYGPAGQGGDRASSVVVQCEARGKKPLLIPAAMPAVAARVGIDLEPGDVRDADQMRWQRALIWPDQPERAALFERALEVARRDPPRILQGDALETLPGVLAEIPVSSPVVVYHSFTLNQFSPQARQGLDDLLAARSVGRVLFRVSIEWYAGDDCPALRLFTYQDGARAEEHLAHCHHHGRWIEWLGD